MNKGDQSDSDVTWKKPQGKKYKTFKKQTNAHTLQLHYNFQYKNNKF